MRGSQTKNSQKSKRQHAICTLYELFLRLKFNFMMFIDYKITDEVVWPSISVYGIFYQNKLR